MPSQHDAALAAGRQGKYSLLVYTMEKGIQRAA